MSVYSEALIEIPPMDAAALRLTRGQTLLVVDPCGEQVADLVAFDAEDGAPLSNGRTFDYNNTIRLTQGHVLYSAQGRPLLRIVRDDVGMHDFLLAPCAPQTWRMCYGDETDMRPGCLGNLERVLAPFGIESERLPTAFNVFMNVEVSQDGGLTIHPPRSRPGDAIEFLAERSCIVGLTACSAMQTNNGRLKPIRYAVVSAP